MRHVVALQALASLLMFAPLLWLNIDSFAGNTDAIFYTTVLKLVANHLAAGDLYPLWLHEANGGAGSPVLLYYSPLPYIITALIGSPIASIDPLGIYRLLLGMFAAQWLAGIFAYQWLTRIVDHKAALYGSLLFTVFPYKFVYIFLHVNLTQLWALALLPLLMIAAHDIAAKPYRALPRYAIYLALLALIHPRTLVAFAFVPAAYAFIITKEKSRVLGCLLLAHMLAAGLAAAYVLPAVLNLDHIQAVLANASRMDYAVNLSHKDMLLNFHYAVIAAMVIGFMARHEAFRKNINTAPQAYYFLAILFVVTLLCLGISKPLWDSLVILQFLQFPAARLHALALIAATGLAALLIAHAEHSPASYRRFYSPRIIMAATIGMTAITLQHVHTIYKGAQGLSRAYIEDMHRLNPILPPEYLTAWQKDNENSYHVISALSGRRALEVVTGQGNAGAEIKNRHIALTADVTSPHAIFRIRQLYMPEWSAGGFPVSPGKHGFIELALPKGTHALDMRLGEFRGQMTGRNITFISILIISLLFFRNYMLYRKA